MPRITVTHRSLMSVEGKIDHLTRTWTNENGRTEPRIRAEGQFMIVTDSYGAETWLPFDLVLRVDVSEPPRSF